MQNTASVLEYKRPAPVIPLIEFQNPVHFSDTVYNNLPLKIKKLCDPISDPHKKDVALIGMITALSAAFSRFRFFHGSDTDVKEYSPHLLSLVVAAAGSGKGLTRYGVALTGTIGKKAIEMQKESLKKHKVAKSQYDQQLRKLIKEGKSCEDLIEPEKPSKTLFAISASDTTQAALVEILNENAVGCFAYDSEIDTLVQGNGKKDFGGFSDVIRKAFHHEPLARQRKGEGESYIVQEPRLALMLSGTNDQLKKLIPSEQNGLFSRFWYYSIPPNFIEYKVATQQVDTVGEMCNVLANEIFNQADLWSDEVVYLKFTEQQEKDLFDAMQDKKAIELKYGGDISASWLRMALIIKRIAATLSGFQGTENGIVADNCWKAALALLPSLKLHCIEALNLIRERTKNKINISKTDYELMKKGGMTDEAIAKELGVDRGTLIRRKKEWAE